MLFSSPSLLVVEVEVLEVDIGCDCSGNNGSFLKNFAFAPEYWMSGKMTFKDINDGDMSVYKFIAYLCGVQQ